MLAQVVGHLCVVGIECGLEDQRDSSLSNDMRHHTTVTGFQATIC